MRQVRTAGFGAGTLQHGEEAVTIILAHPAGPAFLLKVRISTVYTKRLYISHRLRSANFLYFLPLLCPTKYFLLPL